MVPSGGEYLVLRVRRCAPSAGIRQAVLISDSVLLAEPRTLRAEGAQFCALVGFGQAFVICDPGVAYRGYIILRLGREIGAGGFSWRRATIVEGVPICTISGAAARHAGWRPAAMGIVVLQSVPLKGQVSGTERPKG